MRRCSIPREAADDTGIDLTSLLDVVFIMLIFFIVTATFVRETGLDATRSESDSNSAPDLETILVRIDAGDEFWIDGANVSAASLSARLTYLHSLGPEAPVVIQPDGASTAQALARVIDATNQARINEVAIADAPDMAQF